VLHDNPNRRELLVVIDLLIFQSPANLYRGFEGVGGKLELAEELLHFVPHAINIQKDEEIIYLRDIMRVEKINTLGIIPNGFKVTTTQQEYRFVVRKKDQWIAKINKQMKIALSTFKDA